MYLCLQTTMKCHREQLEPQFSIPCLTISALSRFKFSPTVIPSSIAIGGRVVLEGSAHQIKTKKPSPAGGDTEEPQSGSFRFPRPHTVIVNTFEPRLLVIFAECDKRTAMQIGYRRADVERVVAPTARLTDQNKNAFIQ